MGKYKIIHSSVYNPITFGKKNDKAEYMEIVCSNSEECDIFKNKCCVLRNFSLGSMGCPYGKKQYEMGPTRRSKKFCEFIESRTNQIINLGITKYEKTVAYIGDYVYLYVAHLNLNDTLKNFIVGGTLGYFGSSYLYVKKEEFTCDFIEKYIFNFFPTALMGGKIHAYQDKSIPMFCKHLNDLDPELFNELAAKNESIKKHIGSVSRRAYLSTVLPGMHDVIIDKGAWIWDGEWLKKSDAKKTAFVINGKYSELLVKPLDPSTLACVITHEDQTDENTVFIE